MNEYGMHALCCYLQYGCTQPARTGRISSKGVEWKGIELGDEITMATRTSVVSRGMWEGVAC